MDTQINYNNTFATSHSNDGVFNLIGNGSTLLKGEDKRPNIINEPGQENVLDKAHSRDFYRGRSFRYVGQWTEGVHYISDEYLTDFVVRNGVLLVCTKSHMSSAENVPSDWIRTGDVIVGINSEYWDVVLVGGMEGKAYRPVYDMDSDSLIWTLLDPFDLPEEYTTYLGIRNLIDYMIGNIGDRIDSLEGRMNNFEGDIAIIQIYTSHISNEISGISNDLESFKQDTQITLEGIDSSIADLEGSMSHFQQTADGFMMEVQDLENNLSQLWLTSTEFGVRVSNNEEDIAQLVIRANEISTRIENAEGDISQIHQFADEISSEVENVRGDVSRVSQRADEISTQVENALGDVSSISQRADIIQTQVENVQGDVSRISQRADEIQATVEDAEGSISQVTQRADLIEQTVRSNKQDLDGALLEMESKIRQTATEIYSEVSSNRLELDNKITSTNSRITQQAGLIEQKVSQAEYDTRTGQIEQSISAVDQKADNISQSVEHVSGNIDRTAQALSNYILQTDEVLEILLNQADGAIDTWFYEGVPTLNNLPASGWTTDSNKEEHLGDLYYDKLTGRAYRFIKDNNTYCWSAVTDNSLAEALALAAEAKDTADGKRRVFVREPVPPYDEGDLWVQGHIASGNNANNGMIYVCINSRATGIFVDSDWAIAFDLVTIKKAKSSFELFADAIEGRVWQEDGNGIITGNTYSRVKQTVDTINLHIENTKSALRATGIDIYGVQFDEYGVPINGGTVVITADNFKIQANNSNVQDAISITLVDGHPKISASSLEVEGIFSNTPGSIWLSKVGALNTTAQGYATAALNSAKSYADNTALNAISTAESYVQTLLWGNGTAQDPASGTILKRLNEIIDLGGSLDTAVNNMEDTVTTMGTTVSGMSYLTQALLNGSTASVGGLLLSSLIQLGYNNNGNWTIWSGINGVYNNNPNINPDASAQDAAGYGNGIAAWYGGQMADRFYNVHNATSTAAKALFRMDGSGYLAKKNIKWEADGSGSLAGDNITWDANGKLTVKGGVLTTELKAGYELYDNWVVMSGISGDYDNIISDPSAQDVPLGHGIAAWFGGDRLDKEITENIDNPTAATTVFRFDGSGYLADGAISWGPSGSLHLGDSVLFGDSDTTASQILANVLRLASYFTDETITLDGVERHILRINTDGQEQNSPGFIGVAWDGLLLTSGDQIVGDTMDLQGLPKEDIRHVIMSQDEWDSFENPDPGVIYMIYE